jgi:hypothetical protein
MPEDGSAVGPIDHDILDRIGRRLAASDRFETVEYRPPYAPDSLVADYDTGYFPAAVERAYLRVRWFETGDFGVQYSEQYGDGDRRGCRWDRHPNDHNTREHFHPPPDAATPGENAALPDDWRAVLSVVLCELDAGIEAFWD